jgi:hypothetical protein
MWVVDLERLLARGSSRLVATGATSELATMRLLMGTAGFEPAIAASVVTNSAANRLQVANRSTIARPTEAAAALSMSLVCLSDS